MKNLKSKLLTSLGVVLFCSLAFTACHSLWEDLNEAPAPTSDPTPTPSFVSKTVEIGLEDLGLTQATDVVSDDTKIATVKIDDDGKVLVTSIAPGETVVTVKDGNKIATVKIVVDDTGEIVVTVQDKFVFTPSTVTVKPLEVNLSLFDKAVSENEKIATVKIDGDVIITSVGEGETLIKLFDDFREASVKVKVTVTGEISIIEYNKYVIDATSSNLVTLKQGDIALTYDESNPEKLVFTADVSSLGLKDEEVIWLVNNVQKSTGKNFEMNYTDYKSEVYQVSACVSKGIRTYTSQAIVKFEFVYLYECEFIKGVTLRTLISGNKIIWPFNESGGTPMPMFEPVPVRREKKEDNPNTVDSVTGEGVNLIRFEKMANYGIYSGEKNIYVHVVDEWTSCLSLDETGNTFFVKGSYYKGYDASAGENSDFDMILFSNENGTFLIPLVNLTSASPTLLDPYKIGTSSAGITDTPILYKDPKNIKYHDSNYVNYDSGGNKFPLDLYQNSEGYVLIGGEKYYILETVQYTESGQPTPP